MFSDFYTPFPKCINHHHQLLSPVRGHRASTKHRYLVLFPAILLTSFQLFPFSNASLWTVLRHVSGRALIFMCRLQRLRCCVITWVLRSRLFLNMKPCILVPTFLRNLQPPSHRLENGYVRFLRNFGTYQTTRRRIPESLSLYVLLLFTKCIKCSRRR